MTVTIRNSTHVVITRGGGVGSPAGEDVQWWDGFLPVSLDDGDTARRLDFPTLGELYWESSDNGQGDPRTVLSRVWSRLSV